MAFPDKNEKITITAGEDEKRLDIFLTAALDEALPDRTITRSGVKKLIDGGAVFICENSEKKQCKAGFKVSCGDVFEVVLPEIETLENVLPENIPLDIVCEDSDIIVINKPRGMVVHPGAGNYTGTLVNAILYHSKDLSDINGVIRPGIVHRIDRDTTGLICVAKNNEAHVFLARQLEDHTMHRIYYAILEGNPRTETGTIDKNIARNPQDRKKMCVTQEGGRRAVTHFTVLSQNKGFSLVKVRLETGRTHQIRVHMQSIGHPVVGDPLYGIKNTRGLEGQLLHAGELSLIHPKTKEMTTFYAKIPADFYEFAEKNGLLNDKIREELKL